MVCKKKHFDLKNEIGASKNLHNDTKQHYLNHVIKYYIEILQVYL